MSRSQDALDSLEVRLGYPFKNRDLLGRALTHRSYSHESGRERWDNYERLEFLGDALLGFLVAETLFEEDGRTTEGVLTRRRQSVVREGTLAEAAAILGLGQALLLGKGEERTGGRSRKSMLSDIFEAVLAAIYLDGGVEPARAFVRRHLAEPLDRSAAAAEVGDDFKTRFQEVVQARLQRTPRYRIVSASGPAHERSFDVEVLLDGEVLGRGSGPTRKAAEQEAARRVLECAEGPWASPPRPPRPPRDDLDNNES